MKKILVWVIIGLIALLAALSYWKFGFTYSEGYRAGLLQKFSYKGTMFKTYEGEIILSSVESSDQTTLASEKFFFSVTEDELARKIEQLQGDHVVVHYRQKNGTLPWRGDSPYLVDSIRVADKIPLRN